MNDGKEIEKGEEEGVEIACTPARRACLLA